MGRRGVLAAAATVLAGCQQPGALSLSQSAQSENAVPRLGPNRTGYMAVQAPITNRLRDVFIAGVNRMLDQGAAEVHVLIVSPGGSVGAAQDIIAFMDKTRSERGVTFITHNAGVVASAACYVFLAGQRRLSVPGGKFLFHEAALVTNRPLTSRNLDEASTEFRRIERSFLTMLTTKTKLTEGEASSFVRRTVILDADEARRDGIVEAVSGFTLPQGANILNIRAVPNEAGRTNPAQQPAPGA
jgi:ATP-dependent protease ClpP protease subunit